MEKYIPKSALVAWIERIKADALQKKSQCKRSGLERMMHQIGAYNKILSFLDTLEVKEIQEFPVSYKQSPVVLYGLTGSVGNTKEESQVKESAKIERDKETCKENGDSLTLDGVITFDYYEDNGKTYGCVAHDSFCLEDWGLKDMDKVKILILKK